MEIFKGQDGPGVRAEPVDQGILIVAHREDSLPVTGENIFHREWNVEFCCDRAVHVSYDTVQAAVWGIRFDGG